MTNFFTTGLLLGALGLLAPAAAAQTATPPLDSLRARAVHTLHAKRYADAARLFAEQATAEPFRLNQASAHYNRACALALGGQPTAAVQALDQAQRLGFNKLDLLRTDTDLASLRALPGYATVVQRLAQAEARLTDPRNARLVTSDITLFWRAYDRVAKDTAHAAEIYQREYINKGSVGLQDYFVNKIGSVDLFVKRHRPLVAYYRAIRPNTLRIASMAPQIQAGFAKLHTLYPEARFPNVYFVIGCWTSGGTATSNGMLIGADMQVRTPDTPLGELSLWQRNNLGTLAGLPGLVAHEHIHYIQKKSNDPSLLKGAIDEGMADFIAELATGQNPNARLQAYGRAHEKEIWADFRKEMAGPSWSNWIANATQETADKPADLGYFVGYQICRSYYQELADKKQAVHDILNISDYPAFLARSRYAEKVGSK